MAADSCPIATIQHCMARPLHRLKGRRMLHLGGAGAPGGSIAPNQRRHYSFNFRLSNAVSDPGRVRFMLGCCAAFYILWLADDMRQPGLLQDICSGRQS
ncbi:hypothetical protein NDU88_005637 [Pleurodeles waltl]|uniref:Uncharacterized protein n=1 Tax=Pleurodeles waltl TaxID=8319 RepID=A0AAV7NS09_PLEWA|nr:hypothetical protein NDU88_005637 [Pleurodeles waltl]